MRFVSSLMWGMTAYMQMKSESFKAAAYVLFGVVTVAVMTLCVCVGSVSIPLSGIAAAVWNTVLGIPIPSEDAAQSIVVFIRLPRVICVALVGAALSLSGGAMQGLLRNPLADGSTLGVSSGASLGAVISIAFGITFPAFPFAGTMVMAILFAFLSLIIILSLARGLDFSLSTNTIILIGIVFSMFANSIMSFIITLSHERVRAITFWTMGSLSGSSYQNALLLMGALLVLGGILLGLARELNALAIGEDNARHVGVDVKKVKLKILITVSALIGICVSIGGSIGFVGLIMPHMTRRAVGPNHRRLLSASMFSGAVFLMLADLAARTLLSPLELPIGVVTSFIGAIVFVYIFYSFKKVR